MIIYISLPFTTNAPSMKNDLNKFLCKYYPCADFRFVFKNPLTIGSLFSFKDSLPELMCACCVYLYTCPSCKFGTYVGCSKRLLKVRIDSHKGVSYRTGSSLSNKEHSAIRSHSSSCKVDVNYDQFKILCQAPSERSLLFLESLYIKHLSPTLNNQTTSIPLHIAWHITTFITQTQAHTSYTLPTHRHTHAHSPFKLINCPVSVLISSTSRCFTLPF